MRREKPIITLLSAGQARVGEVFLHRGPGPACAGCKYFNVCVGNLESGRVYRVIGVRNKTLKCVAYDLEMRVVEVAEAEVPAAIPSKQAIKGVTLTFHSQDCGEHDCENAALCLPEYLRDNDRCEVIEVYEGLRCPRGFHLKRVLLRRAPPS
ncbi:MAG: UPF0179 family protein [Candidatus Bathyarchaeia archaeon]|nr:UPF0179 family protein [Candidatus Bathyarchaeota archaeon]